MTSLFAGTDTASPNVLDKVSYDQPYGSSGTKAPELRPRVLVLRDREVLAEDAGEVPAWVGPVIGQLAMLYTLRPNWDSYGARPLNRGHAAAALTFLGRVMTDGMLVPDLVPLADGGLQVEWRRPGLEIDFVADDEVATPVVLVTRGEETTEFRVDTASPMFYRQLRDALAVDDHG